jgi:hypothetical protein
MRRKPFVPALLTLLVVGCGDRTPAGPLPPGPQTGVLSLVLHYDRDEARRAGADSALIRVRNLFVAPGQFHEVRRVPLAPDAGQTAVDLELWPRTGYVVAVVAYNSRTGEAFAGAELHEPHAATVTRGGRSPASLRLVPWRAALYPPPLAFAGRTVSYPMRLVQAPERPDPRVRSPLDDVFVHSWGLLVGLQPWTPESRPAPVELAVRGGSAAGAELTYFVYHPAPEVTRDTTLYLQGVLWIGGPEWRERPGAAPRTLRVFTEGIESVPVVAN